jgi:hypothetical protein
MKTSFISSFIIHHSEATVKSRDLGARAFPPALPRNLIEVANGAGAAGKK